MVKSKKQSSPQDFSELLGPNYVHKVLSINAKQNEALKLLQSMVDDYRQIVKNLKLDVILKAFRYNIYEVIILNDSGQKKALFQVAIKSQGNIELSNTITTQNLTIETFSEQVAKILNSSACLEKIRSLVEFDDWKLNEEIAK